jgi:hypothetical protein
MTQAQIAELAPWIFSIGAGFLVFSFILSVAGWFLDYMDRGDHRK